jgi:hypothetical protein
MRVMYERCCGLDIHKASITVCALITEKGKTQEETRRFGTMTADLRELAGWLQQKGMEASVEYFGACGRLSRKLCLKAASTGCLEAGLKHGIELRQHLVNALIGRSPFSIFKG